MSAREKLCYKVYMEILHHTVDADEGEVRLDRLLKRLGVSGQVPKLIRTGQVRINGKRASGADRLQSGDVVRVPMFAARVPEPSAPRAPVPLPDSMVLFRDDSLMVLNKPHGLATQGGSGLTTHVDALLAASVREGQRRPVSIHRLDRDTSGCLLVARKPGVAAALGKLMQSRAIRKVYRAIVYGVPEHARGRIEVPLRKIITPDGERVRAAPHDPEAQHAITEYTVLDHMHRAAALLAMSPLTGRTHQLRVHATHIGHPMLGDGKYALPALPETKEGAVFGVGFEVPHMLHLHAHRLEFVHPITRKTIRVTAPMPPHMRRSCAEMGFDPNLPDDF